MASPYRKAQLIADLAAGRTFATVLFLDHRRRGAEMDAACLSQWWPAPFTVDGDRFATAEHFMMHAKARHFGDAAVAAEILAAPHPFVAKQLGRRVRGFDEVEWRRVRETIVHRGSGEKFRQNPAERDWLLATGAAVLIEATAEDRVWGSGLWANHPGAKDPRQWPGENLLGFVLMDVRTALTGGTANGA